MSTHKGLYQAFTSQLTAEDQQRKPDGKSDSSSPSPSTNPKRHPYEIDHIKIPDAEYMSEVPEHLRNKDIFGFPTTVLVVGPPGKGKSNLLINMLTRKEFYLHFFDKIYLLGPTVKTDKLYKLIKVPENQIVDKEEEFIPKLVEWTNKQKDDVKNDSKTAPKALFLFEDITAYRNTVQNNPNFAKCFTTIRHHKAVVYANVHKYCSLERTARMSCMHLACFPMNRTDQKALFEEYGGSYVVDFEDFHAMLRYAWEPTAENKKPFLHINMYADEKERFRKGFTEVLDVDYFRGKGRAERKKMRKDAEDRWGASDKSRNPKNKRKFEHMAEKNINIPGAQDLTSKPPSQQVKKAKQVGVENSSGPFGPDKLNVSNYASVKSNIFAYVK